MLRIVNYSNNNHFPLATEHNDIQSAINAVLAITVDKNEANKAERIAKSMHFGDVYSATSYRMSCVDHSEYSTAMWIRDPDGLNRCPNCGHIHKDTSGVYKSSTFCLACGTRIVTKKPVYTHDEASRIIELFEGILGDNDIIIPSPEDDDREEDNEAALYGSVYSDLLDEIEYILIDISERIKSGADFIPDRYSGEY